MSNKDVKRKLKFVSMQIFAHITLETREGSDKPAHLQSLTRHITIHINQV